MKRLLIVALLPALASHSAATAQTTSKFTATKASEYGLVYTLPLTGLQVTLEAQKTVKTPGEFARYAGKYLNTTPVLAASTDWKLLSGQVSPTAVPDESQRYLTTMKGGVGVYMMLTPEGFPVSINDEEYTGETEELDILPEAVPALPTILEKPIAKQAVTPDMIKSTSSAKRAELAAEKIYELRGVRSEIISGQAESMPSDGAAMKLALEQISGQEEALTAMFNGTEQVSTDVITFDVALPSAESLAVPYTTIVARLSPAEGFVAADDLSGEPVYLTVTPLTQGKLPLNEKGLPKTFPKGGVAYRIPGTSKITLTFNHKTIFEKTIDVAQTGVVFGLDPALFTAKKAPSYLHFSPLTGAVRELGVKD